VNCNFSPTAPGPLNKQFRNSVALQLNYFWPQNFMDDPVAASVWFADMVVATVRIGCRR
jgi:hypothetical protein